VLSNKNLTIAVIFLVNNDIEYETIWLLLLVY